MRGIFLSTVLILIGQQALADNCQTLVQRITQLDSSIVTTNRFHFSAPTKGLQGLDTGNLYSTEWVANTSVLDKQARTAIYFNFRGDESDVGIQLHLNHNETEAPRTTAIKIGSNLLLPIPNDSKPEVHRLQIDLPRDGEDGFIDLNLATEVFSHLAGKSLWGESYAFVLNDPSVVDALNEKLNALLTNMQFYGDAPRRTSYDIEEPLATLYNYDPLQQSFFPSLAEEEVKEALDVLRKHLNLREELLQCFLKTKLGETVQKSGEWDISIEIEGFSLADALELKDIDLRPYVYTYKVYLRAR